MSVIGRPRRRWLALPLAAALLLAVAVPLWINRGPAPVYASGVAASSISTTGQDTTNDFTNIRFDIDWNNSWRDAVNWDAVWVFVKFSVSGGAWKHATLSSTAGHHSVTTTNGVAVTIDPASDGKGVFMYRTSVGNGANNWDKVKLRWNYGADTVADSASVKLKVFAIEMVHIPQGEFDLGDGNGSAESVNAFHGAENTKVRITASLVSGIDTDTNTEDDSQLEGTGIGIDGDGGLDTDNNGSIDNASYPTGYTAFYIMKHEASQEQYAEFLNTLTSTQQSTRFALATGGRHSLQLLGGVYGANSLGNSVLNEAADGQNIPNGYISYQDLAAYADWAGMRPFTELEFEKASRGPTSAVLNEFVWGNTSRANSAYTLSNTNLATEVIATNYATGSVGNIVLSPTVGSIGGPVRAGIFATSSSSRTGAGATYYGVLEMSGNLWEIMVNVSNATGRAFAGSHGDGVLSTNGNATNSDWPGYVSAEVTGATGSGLRGSSYADGSTTYPMLSSRQIIAFNSTNRLAWVGFRVGRTAP